MDLILMCIIYCGGVLAGIILASGRKTIVMGTIIIDETDPNKDLYTFEFSKAPAIMHGEKKVIFEISQK